ncbi:MHYT domain-containing protein [Nocardioides sp. CER19]|uniref:MHYT domain-containing protein n=1 Tax=Nocardioides sp. CER19 TaxID=3038538 RepID=UPI00244811E4|nr:MHYT domain-containing protein [Nocardioides sp. CER19]MDH2415314.1 MHYT domain-containing protein [Nocardioides sp. CER19]
MPDVSTSVTMSSFDSALVGLSFLIAVFGAWCGLSCAARAARSSGSSTGGWLAAAAAALGGGTFWSMHFIGMLAYHGSVVYRLKVAGTALSFALAIGAALLGVAVASRVRGWLGCVVGGLVLGGGASFVHFTAMSAMKMNATTSYRGSTVALSVAIAVVSAILALTLTLKVRRAWGPTVASLVLGAGVCGMFYVAMLALTVTPRVTGVDLDLAKHGADPFSLAMPVFGITAVLLFVLLFTGIFGARQDGPAPEPAPVAEPEPEPAV